ncbi:MAG TPA: glutathione S-transferase family protein [Steroidobacteraceae bacterium]|nr:glutathione S-transferase family protein [Steroidobacteraceae bacterium]
MKLMFSPTSPFVRRVRAAAIELGLAERITLEAIQVAPVRQNDAYAAGINPLRKVPALVLDDGRTTLVDSSVICLYLDELAGGNRLLPRPGAERWDVLTRQAVALGMTDALVLSRYETSLRPQALRWPEWAHDQEDRFWSGLGWFEERLAGPAAADGTPDLAQLALACCLGYADFRFPAFNWRERAPLAAAHYARLLRRPSLASTGPS